MSNIDVVYRAERAILPTGEVAASVAIKDGIIVAVGALEDHYDCVREVRLASDEVLLPGLVDSHVHINEPGRTDWEGFETATKAAGAGGITTVIDMPLNSIPPTTTLAALHTKKAAAALQVRIDTGFWGGAIPGNCADLEPLWQAGVFGFKCFLADSGVPEFPALNAQQMREHMAEIARIGALLIVHAEDAAVLADAPAVPGPEYANFVASRPGTAETIAIKDVIAAMRETGARVHILHLSCADAIPTIREAKAEGLPLTVETCPHYLTFEAESVPPGATQYKCCPPIREHENRMRLWQGLFDGDIDLIASDHSPCTPELKQMDVGDFQSAWGGVASVELGLRSIWTQLRGFGRPLTDLVRWMALKPAELCRLENKGRIAVGADGDLCIFAPEVPVCIDVHELHHKNPVTPYDGRNLFGEIRATVLAGNQIDLEIPRGRLLARSATN